MNQKERSRSKLIQWEFDIPPYTDLDKVINLIQKELDKIPSNAKEIYKTLKCDASYGYYDSIEADLKGFISYWIPLVGEELAKKEEEIKRRSAAARMSAKEKREKKEAQERALLEKLKAKYE